MERLKENRKPIAVMAAVGVLALIAIALLIQLLSSGPAGTADASPAGSPLSTLQVTPSNPAPSAEPVAPTPTATPYVGFEQPLPVGAGPTSFWARVLVNDLRVRDAAGSSGTAVDAVSAGDVVYALETKDVDGATWYRIFMGGKGFEEPPPRWVAAGPPDSRYLARIGGAARKLPDLVRGLAAGPSGYLAWGTTERTTETYFGAPLIMTSVDGTSWTRQGTEAFKGAEPETAAWGPGGWLVAASPAKSGESYSLWLSADGRDWEEVGHGPGGPLLPDVNPYGVSGSAAGYVVTLSGPKGTYLSFSPNGRGWQAADFGNATPISSGETFVAVSEAPDPAVPPPAQLRVFTNGRWLDVDANEMPAFQQPRWAASGSVFVMFDRRLDKSLQVWAGTITAGRLSWRRQPTAEAAFGDAGLSDVVGSSTGFLAVGWNAETMAPITWTSTDGVTWKRNEHAADEFGGAVAAAVRAPVAAVVLGSDPRPGYRGQRLFRSDDLATWSPVEVSTLEPLDPTAGGCPQPPRDMGDLLGIDGELGAACFGDRPITLRGFATSCGGCGGFSPGTYEPGWLAGPFSGVGTYLAPFEVDAGYGRPIIVHPDVADQWVDQRWLEVTGHFDDPASTTCHMTMTLEFWAEPVPRDDVVASCRQRFVVTAIKVVDGP